MRSQARYLFELRPCISVFAGRLTVVVKSRLAAGRWSSGFRTTIPRVDIHASARKHGIAEADIEHATANAMIIEDPRRRHQVYLGPARSATLLEVVTIVRDDGSELAIHAMAMRPKYQALLPRG